MAGLALRKAVLANKLVRMSEGFSLVLMYTIVIVPSSHRSREKKYLPSICLVRVLRTSFDPTAMVLWLSTRVVTGSSAEQKSFRTCIVPRRHLMPSTMATRSASVEDRVTIDCLLDPNATPLHWDP